VLAARHAVYQDARQRNPQRWSGPTRNWTPVGVVTLNPERDSIVRATTSQILLSGSIGEPAFPSRPGSAAQATARNGGEWEEQSHPEPRAARPVARERGEAGEHRTFPAVSTVAHLSPVGGSHPRTSTPQAQRLRRSEESLRNSSGNYLETHRTV
jgi:hypothetical protein